MSNDVLFEQVNPALYIARNVTPIINKIKTYVSELSGGVNNKFEPISTERIVYTLLSRAITTEFINQLNEGKVSLKKDAPFAAIQLEGFDNSISFTVGSVYTSKNDIIYVNGVNIS